MKWEPVEVALSIVEQDVGPRGVRSQVRFRYDVHPTDLKI